MKLQGIFIDTATPFDHNGDLYRVKIEHNIGKWNQTNVSGYVIGGRAGEGALLSAEEKIDLWRIAAASASPGRLLIAGIDTPGVHEASSQINQAAAHGFAAALVETPSYDNPETLLLYFRSVADRASIPILIAGLPAGHPNIAAVLDRAGQVHDLPTLCGSETTLWSALTRGAVGAVLPLASAAPYACIALWEAHRTREEDAGLDWQSRITPAAELINGSLGVAGLKHAMDRNGFYGGPPRLPRTILDPQARSLVEQAFDGLNG